MFRVYCKTTTHQFSGIFFFFFFCSTESWKLFKQTSGVIPISTNLNCAWPLCRKIPNSQKLFHYAVPLSVADAKNQFPCENSDHNWSKRHSGGRGRSTGNWIVIFIVVFTRAGVRCALKLEHDTSLGRWILSVLLVIKFELTMKCLIEAVSSSSWLLVAFGFRQQNVLSS